MTQRWSDLALAVLAAILFSCTQVFSAAVPLSPQKRMAAADQIREQLEGAGNYALVIGISDFADAAWASLPGVRMEMEAVSAAFEGAHKFTIVTPGHGGGNRMTKHELQQAIRSFIARYGQNPENRLIIYIASHGYRDVAAASEDGYVVASDSLRPGRRGFEASAYSVEELAGDMAENKARHLFLFVNTCFSGSLIPVSRHRGPGAEPGGDGTEPAALSEDVARWVQRTLARDARVILTAGDAAQEVPDDSEYWRAVVDGLAGGADGNHDGLILDVELAAYVKGRVGPRTLSMGIANDPLFARLPAAASASELPGEFVFLSPIGPSAAASAGISHAAQVLAARRSRLSQDEFTECAECPVMVALPPVVASNATVSRIALARTEATFAEWDACYRDLGCRRYVPDYGQGRGDRPVGGLTWQDALEFVAWLEARKGDRCEAYRLPTREEWLAGAGLADLVPAHGNAAMPYTPRPSTLVDAGTAVCRGCGGDAAGDAAPTASLPANNFGLYDMAGNLWEWVQADGLQCDLTSLREHPRCAEDGTVMGGSFATAAAALDAAMVIGASVPRTANRRPFSLPTVGLRVACQMTEAAAMPAIIAREASRSAVPGPAVGVAPPAMP